MSGEKAPEAKPTALEEQAKAEAEAAAKAASEARAKLKLIKVVSTRKVRVDSPSAAWSLAEGANHFEGDVPEDVAKVYAKLITDKVVTVEWIDGSGKAHPWIAPKLPNDDGKQH